MIETKSLANLELLENTSVVVADIDFTLVDFARAHTAAIKSLIPRFGNEFSKNVDEIFNLINEEHQQKDSVAWNKKADFEKIVKEIFEIEKPSISQHGLKKWSRESWMILAQKMLNLNLNSTDIEKCRDTYWKTHANNSYLYEDAQIFLNELKKRNIPLILMTSSDSVMKINSDLTLSYDPEFSGSYKMKRIKMLPLQYKSIILGEIVDKPDTKFFDLVYKDVFKLGLFDKKTVLFVGDSPKGDLMVPEKDGYNTLLVKR